MQRLALLICWLLILLCAPAMADGTVALSPQDNVVDLAPHGTRISSQRRNIALDVPGEAPGARAVLELRSQGPGPVYDWTVYTITNAGPASRSFVFMVDDQGLTASGFTDLAPFGPQVINVQAIGAPLKAQPVTGSNAQAFTLAAGMSVSIGVEGNPVLSNVRVYDDAAFTRREASLAFLRGASLALALVLTLACFANYGLRRRAGFVAAGMFGIASLLFMQLEAGYAETFLAAVPGNLLNAAHLRAISESLLALAIAGCMASFTTASAQMPRGEKWQRFAMLPAALCLLLAFVLPDVATRLARVLALAAAAAGLVQALRPGLAGTSAQAGISAATRKPYPLLFWVALCLWMLFAIVAALNTTDRPVFKGMILAGLAGVMCVLALASMLIAMAENRQQPRPANPEETRRALALSGAQHHVWDWDPRQDKLDVSPELARDLGFPADYFGGKHGALRFAQTLHPDDAGLYAKQVAAAAPGYSIDMELRLMDAAGEPHWYALRASSVEGASNVPRAQGRLAKPAPARMLGTLTSISRAKQAEEQQASETVRDPVTGLPSRALFMDRLDRELNKMLALPVQVLMIGLERFKTLNDGLGHDLADQLLLLVGQRIGACLKEGETLSRLSGSQFAVMFIEMMDSRDALTLAEQIVSELAEPIGMGNQDVYLTTCIGISQSSGLGSFTAEELQRQAASALHAAQSEGPGSILVFDPEMKDERADRLLLELDLRRAIERHEIEVYYQPIIHLETRAVAGLEALARWNHPERGLVPPSDFIAMAEQAGVILEVGELVLSEAARQMGIWQRVLIRGRPMFVAINVTADHISSPEFVDSIGLAIQREGLHPHALKIEVTESVVMRYPERARNLISRLRGLGVGVACDDFGTGFSNLAALRELQFDTLKIDRSFLADSGTDERGDLIISSVINLAHSLGMRVVAEGIESEDQLQRLLALGCDLGQGYLLGQAVPARDVHQLLAVLPVMPPLATVGYTLPESPASSLAARSHFTVDEAEAVEPEPLPSIYNVEGFSQAMAAILDDAPLSEAKLKEALARAKPARKAQKEAPKAAARKAAKKPAGRKGRRK